jgi:hypothetical protein
MTGTSGSGQTAYGYDWQRDELSFKDQNGTTHGCTLDAVGRDTADSVTLASGNPYNIDTTVMSLGFTYNDAGLRTSKHPRGTLLLTVDGMPAFSIRRT